MALFGSRSDPEFNLQPVWDAVPRGSPCPLCGLYSVIHSFAIPLLVGVILPSPGLLVSVVLIKFHRSEL